jgi:hypothetical protein
VPAIWQPPTPLPPGGPQVPFALAPTLTQLPLQHWLFVKQTSVSWVQKETAAEQTPFRHRFEQQSPLPPHPLPAVRQPPPGLTGAQTPPLQRPLQQLAFVLHAPGVGLSWMHGCAAHWRFEPQ